MKKSILFVLAALLSLSIMGVAHAAGIPVTVDPQNSPEIWTMEVYNNSASALTSGRVVVWDIDASTTPAGYRNRLMYVNTTSSEADVWTAGVVVSPSIAAGEVGTICIWGPVYALCADSTANVSVNELVSTSTVTGQAGDFTGSGADNAALGVALASAPNTVANGGYGGSAGNNFVMIPIFVDPTRFSDN